MTARSIFRDLPPHARTVLSALPLLGAAGLSYRLAVDMLTAEQEALAKLLQLVPPEHRADVLTDVDDLQHEIDRGYREGTGPTRRETPRCEALRAITARYAAGKHRTQESR